MLSGLLELNKVFSQILTMKEDFTPRKLKKKKKKERKKEKKPFTKHLDVRNLALGIPWSREKDNSAGRLHNTCLAYGRSAINIC